MKSFGKALRKRIPAVGLGLVSALAIGATTAVVATPSAYAQAKASREFGEPYTQAREAIQAKNFSGALPLLDKAAPHAADNAQKLAVEQLRTAVYAGTNNTPKLIQSLEAQLALGGLPAATVKSHKATIMGLYAQQGNDAKALQLTKDYVNQYGGTAQQYAYLASSSLKANDRAGAINFGTKAIEQSRAEGAAPKEQLFNIVMKAHYDNEDLDSYYGVLEQAAVVYPKDTYWKALIARSEKAPQFNRQQLTHDLYRAMEAAGISLAQNDKLAMAEQAFTRGMAVEAESVIKPMFDSGEIGGADDKNATRNKRLYDGIVEAANADRAGGLDDSLAEAEAASTGVIYTAIGEAYIGLGQYDKAVELIQKGIDKGGLKPDELAMAQLHKGIAQYKAGNTSAARTTWGEVDATNGAEELARNWTLISRK